MKCLHTLFALIAILVFFSGCKDEKKTAPAPVVKKNVKVPVFDGEQAYSYVNKQVDFGYRIPGTPEHQACKEWLVSTLEGLGTKVSTQDFKASFLGKENQAASNIIAQINPEKTRRILLAAHWDSRMHADKDEDPENHESPLFGADDAGSGVGILLAIAKTIQNNPIDLGVDIVLFDAEDQGNYADDVSWCLGAKHWSKNLQPKNYKPEYGILLDMVGRKGATFYKEGVSMRYARAETEKIWTLAGRMGYSDFFVDRPVGGITDDHRFVNEIAKIPMLDIINMKPGATQNFHSCWHATCDDMSVIDKRSLKVVGQVLTAVLYKESGYTL